MRTVGLVCACGAILALLLVLDTWAWWRTGGAVSGTFILQVEEGAPVASVSRQLAREGALEHPRLWSALARLGGRDGSIKRGEFELDRDMSPGDLLAALVAGRVRQYSVTLPEGIGLAAALAILRRAEALDAVLSGPGDPRLDTLVADFRSAGPAGSAQRTAAPAGAVAEGLFFPDTYHYSRGDTDLAVLETAHRRLREVMAQLWPDRADDLPYADPYEALVMASIVEKETALAAERRPIAGVFVHRLRRNMRLQADPTVIYGLGDSFDGDLRRSHLRDSANPYNTYRHRGLPPTPIALSGRAAMEAALRPAVGSALYFVARGDGSHEFSDTLREHQEAVRRAAMEAAP